MKHARMIGIVGILLAGIFVTQAQSEDYGKVVYQNNCAMCHGATGNGDGPMARGMGARPVDFTGERFWHNDPGKKIRDAVEYGYGAMPPMDLTSGEIKAVSDYIEKTFRK